jgi:hypothetical protein
MKTFLGFLVVALPPYLLALHYHYSSEGILLSSTVAGCFGALLSWQLYRKGAAPGALTVTLGLLGLCGCIYLIMPTQLNLLYALVVVSAYAIYLTQQNSENSVAGGRSELLLTLNPLSASAIATTLQKTFVLWTILSLLAQVLYKLTHMQPIALIPFVAIAVSCSAVQNSWADKEHR